MFHVCYYFECLNQEECVCGVRVWWSFNYSLLLLDKMANVFANIKRFYSINAYLCEKNQNNPLCNANRPQILIQLNLDSLTHLHLFIPDKFTRFCIDSHLLCFSYDWYGKIGTQQSKQKQINTHAHTHTLT